MKRTHWKNLILLVILLTVSSAAQAELTKEIPAPYKERVEKTLSLAGENKAELERFLEEIPSEMREGAVFLVAFMPSADARTLSANFLLRNTQLAYATRAKYPWGKAIPDEIFLDYVLPYAVVDEQREDWRLFLTFRIEPLVREAKTLSQAAYAVGQGAKTALNVKYATSRAKVIQSPSETIMSGVATCSGLSITLVAALRTVGIPARMASIQKWYGRDDTAGHRWVEVWIDGKWYCCELAPFAGFDKGWFLGRIKPESRDSIETHVFVNSYRETGVPYSQPWNSYIRPSSAKQADSNTKDGQRATQARGFGQRGIRVSYLDNMIVPSSRQASIEIPGIDVTERYIGLVEKRFFRQRQENAGKMELTCVVLEKAVTSKEPANRIPCDIKISDAKGKVVGEGKTLTNEHDINDHLTFYLPKGEYTIQYHGKKQTVNLEKSQHVQLVY